MLFAILGYAAAALVGATVVAPVAKKVVVATKSKKDDKVVEKITNVLDQIPVTALVAYLAGKGIKVPTLKF